MKFRVAFLRLIDALVFTGVLAYSVAEEDLIYAAIALPLVIVAAIMTGGPGGAPLPRWLINTALLGVTAYMMLAWYGNVSETVGVLCRYVIALQIVKLFELRGLRDFAQVMLLSVVLVIGACLTSVKADLGGVLLLYIPLLIATTMVFQIIAGQWNLGPAVAVGRRAGSHLRRIIGSTAAMVIALAAVVFVATPRGFGEALIGSWRGPAMQPIVGFRDHVQLGAQGLLSESPAVVMEMRVTSSYRSEPYTRPLLLRGAVLDEYDTRHFLWRRSAALGELRMRRVWRPDDPQPAFPPGKEYLIQRISAIEQPIGLFAAWKPLLATFEPSTRNVIYFPNELAGLLDVRLTAQNGRYVYTVVSAPFDRVAPQRLNQRLESGTEFLARRRPQPWSLSTTPRQCRKPSRVPHNPFTTGPVRELAERILLERDIDPARAKLDAEPAVVAFRQYLQQNYRYTLEMVAPKPGQDPIEMFLFDTGEGGRGGRGHCEYFSSAFAALCLSVNIPARVVTGYAASEVDPVTGVYTIRQSHAHAWVDVELSSGRWREIDPSPSAELQHLRLAPSGFAATVRRVVEALQFAWIRSVVSFDRQSQTAAFRSARESPRFALSRLNDAVAERMTQTPTSRESPTISAARVFASVLVASTVLGVLSLFLFARAGALIRAICRVFRVRPPRSIERLADPRVLQLRRMWRRMERWLRRRNIHRDPAAPPLTFARSVAASDPALGAPLQAFAELYYRASYSAQRPTRETVAGARRHLRSLREALRASGG